MLRQLCLCIFTLFIKLEATTKIITSEFMTDYFSDDDIVGIPAGSKWTISGTNIPSNHFFTQCSGKRIVGGYQVLSGIMGGNPAQIQRTYSNLPPHYAARIKLKLYKIDSWENENLFIMVDGITLRMQSWNSGTGLTDICGQPNPIVNPFNPQFNEAIIQYNQLFSHNSTSLTLKIVSSLNQWTGAWGIRQLQISLQKCLPSCASCIVSSSCSSCDLGLAVIGISCRCTTNLRTIQPNCQSVSCVSCQATCPLGFYPSTSSDCVTCHVACSICTGPGNTAIDCSQCATGYFLGTGLTYCQRCYGLCNTCSGLQFNQCTSCVQLSFLINNQCKTSCPNGYYTSQSRSLCVACSFPCIQCEGSTNGYCLSCIVGQYLYVHTCYTVCPLSLYAYNSVCLPSCPLSTYTDSFNFCQDCPQPQCLTCNQLSECLLCTTGTYFNTIDRMCYSICPPAFYGDNSGAICVPCDLQCLTCFGPSSTECQSCHPLTYLVYQSCYSVCPPHTYSQTCLLCHNNCLQCYGPSQRQCVTCSEYLLLHINESICLQQCYMGDIANSINNTCITCPIGQVGQFGVCVQCYPTCKTCNNTWYDDCSSCVTEDQDSLQTIILTNGTCIFQNTKIIYMPHLAQSSSVYEAIIFVICMNLVLALILECLFTYKTNLLLVIQLMQIISYFYYLSAPFSTSTQKIFLFLYNSHPSAIFMIQNWLATPYSTTPHPNANILPKAQIIGKTAIYLLDSIYFHVIITLCVIIFAISKTCSGSIYKKLNPYIISYGYRLIFMEQFFCAMLFLIYMDLSLQILRWSLVLFIIDLLLIGVSFFWKIRTDMESNHSHYALFYFNELGPPMSQSYTFLNENQLKQRKSILPSLIFYFGKFPFIILIFFFRKQPLTQSICLLIFTVLMTGVNSVIQYRRRIAKYMSYFSNFVLIFSSAFTLVMSYGIDVSLLFDYFILGSFSLILAVTLMQSISNHVFFISVYYHTKNRVIVYFQKRNPNIH